MNLNLQPFFADNTHRKLLLIVDETVDRLYPDFFISSGCETNKILKIKFKGGEECKQFPCLQNIWNILIDNNFEKDDLIINFGGGTISDLGGFAAATFKRAIPFINIPTTLMAMADAAHGGKTGINFHNIKNVIGTVSMPVYVMVNPNFLRTLPAVELLSGFAEIIKCALISNDHLWKEIHSISELNLNTLNPDWITQAYNFKNQIVNQDINDNGIRQILNFGHTLGHAFESYFISNGQRMPHGNAVALGMQYESFISWNLHKITQKEYSEIVKFITRLYPAPLLRKNELETICKLCIQDKKNREGKITLTLLDGIGNASIKQSIDFEYFKEIILQYEV